MTSETENLSFENLFSQLATWASLQAGRAHTFALALGLMLVWGLTGPFFGWGPDWQLVVNTGTTIVTFLMVFLLQHAQNRDTLAIQLKLDELIRATEAASNRLRGIEALTDEELRELQNNAKESSGRG